MGKRLTRDQRTARLAQLMDDVKNGRTDMPADSKASVRNQAMHLLAIELGLTPGALHQQVRRAAAKLDRWSRAELSDPVQLRGMTVDPDFLTMVRQLLTQMDEAKAKMHGALVHLKRIQSGALPFEAPILRSITERAAVLIRDLEESRPVSICPYCRAIAGVIETCDSCGTTGLVCELELKQAPSRLLDDTAPHIVVDGHYKALTKDEPTEEVESEDVADIWG